MPDPLASPSPTRQENLHSTFKDAGLRGVVLRDPSPRASSTTPLVVRHKLSVPKENISDNTLASLAITPDDTGAGFNVSQIEANPAGFFSDVHTVAFPAGAIRGQLSLVDSVY